MNTQAQSLLNILGLHSPPNKLLPITNAPPKYIPHTLHIAPQPLINNSHLLKLLAPHSHDLRVRTHTPTVPQHGLPRRERQYRQHLLELVQMVAEVFLCEGYLPFYGELTREDYADGVTGGQERLVFYHLDWVQQLGQQVVG